MVELTGIEPVVWLCKLLKYIVLFLGTDFCKLIKQSFLLNNFTNYESASQNLF